MCVDAQEDNRPILQYSRWYVMRRGGRVGPINPQQSASIIMCDVLRLMRSTHRLSRAQHTAQQAVNISKASPQDVRRQARESKLCVRPTKPLPATL